MSHPSPSSTSAARRSFVGRRVLITGGSSGIGLALARQLRREGAHVCLAARDPGRLAEAVRSLRAEVDDVDARVCSVELDVTSAASVAEAAPRVLAELGGLDVLVNNAGYAIPGYIERLEEHDFEEMLAVNYLGPVRVIRAFLPHFLARRAGHIVNVTSMLGFMGTFGYAAYSGSKFALSGFTDCLRQDLLPFGVRVSVCYPPTTKTPGLERENRTKPAESWAIEGTSRAFEPEVVARAIVEGVRRRRYTIVVGLDSWFIWFMYRLAPWLVRWVIDRALFQHLGRHGDGRAQLPAAAATAAPSE